MIIDGPNERRIVLLGRGDVAVSGSTCRAGARVDFSDCPQHEIGAAVDPAKLEPPRVTLVFSCVASVDAVIASLRVARQRLEARAAGLDDIDSPERGTSPDGSPALETTTCLPGDGEGDPPAGAPSPKQ